jgi:hypothetical protein
VDLTSITLEIKVIVFMLILLWTIYFEIMNICLTFFSSYILLKKAKKGSVKVVKYLVPKEFSTNKFYKSQGPRT